MKNQPILIMIYTLELLLHWFWDFILPRLFLILFENN